MESELEEILGLLESESVDFYQLIPNKFEL